MNGCTAAQLGTDALPQPGNHRLWVGVLVLLIAWQAWMTLGLFGARAEPARLWDDRPLLSGRHPLHLYHGFLGATALLNSGGLSCYDPNFYAGYPKTPVFDGGSRPAELVLALGGGRYRPGAYKLAVAGLCVAVPIMLWLAARGLALSRAAAALGCLLGLLVWWGGPCRDDLEAGDIDLLLSTVLIIAQSGLLIRFHHDPGVLSFLGIVAAGFLGWFAHPLFMSLTLPLFFVYYLGVGARHRLAWHVALFTGLIGAIAANLFWLVDWVQYWWIRLPLQIDMPLLRHRTFRTVWEATLWGESADRVIACALIAAAAVGVALWNWNRERAAARLFGLAVVGLLSMALLGIAAESIGRLGAARLFVPGLLFAALPAAHALGTILTYSRRHVRTAGAACLVVPVLAGFAGMDALPAWVQGLHGPQPLTIGLHEDRQKIVDVLKEHTTAAARILWEDRHGSRLASRWTALLPVLTGRSFIGGLDPEAGIEHAATGLQDENLAGLPIGQWSDDNLADYCERYNVGWIAAWSPAAIERFRAWPAAQDITGLQDECAGRLFAVHRQPFLSWASARLILIRQREQGFLLALQRRHFLFSRRPRQFSFALTGSAHVYQADSRHIVLEDVKPVDGQVLLSFHYQAGLRVTPSRVQLEGARDSLDPIPLIRLVVKEPVARVTITWDRR